MERQFQINWQLLVEEARQRRKKQKLTQAKLALLAGVSTPTISRFENGEEDIQLSTIMNIFGVLGMLDKRTLVFLDKTVRKDDTRGVVAFIGKDGDKSVQCGVSYEALADHFRGDNKKPLEVFDVNCERIEHEAKRKYIADELEVDGSVLVKTNDFS